MKNFILLIQFFSFGYIQAQKINFYKEDLNFYLDATHFTVEGYYYFSNSSSTEVTQIIFYPFPDKDNLGIVDSVSVYNTFTNKELSIISKNNSGISFPIFIDRYGFVKLKIVYRQSLKGNFAEYILTTTKIWGLPLEMASYKLFVPDKIKIDSISYPADSVKTDKVRDIYYFNKKNFFPKKNFEIYFNY